MAGLLKGLLKMWEGRRLHVWGPLRLACALTEVWIIRYLEEGNIQAAEAQKRRIEQLQRDRRRVMEENNIVHQARFFRCFSLPALGPSAASSSWLPDAFRRVTVGGSTRDPPPPTPNGACFPQASD